MFNRKASWIAVALLVVFSMVLTACGGAAPTAAPEQPVDQPTQAPSKQQVEVFSWWTGGGEAAGLDAMIKVFGGDAPDSWQGHAGQELIGTYVAAGQLEPLNFLYEENGWLDVMPETLIPLISDGGNIYSVPVNIHRANVLWYNPQVLTDNGVEVPATLDDFFAAMDTLKAAGMDAPLAMGEQWTVMHLFETILLATLGPDAYNQLWSGEKNWGDADVKVALENFKKVLTYTNSDSSSLSWQDASQLVVDGDAAFNIMGDWAEGFFKELGKEPMVEFGWAPVPGTNGSFQFLSDSFVLPTGAPNRDAAIAWLTVAGSKEGQDAFNPVKGS
ncbi:MAG: ABC transporter substrate-binding protein, partial [Chloroflexi bacterium HGW-Chloroflexi-10]